MQNPFSPHEMNVGDVSAILQHNAPWYTKHFRKPSPHISFMEDFEPLLVTTSFTKLLLTCLDTLLSKRNE